MAGLQGMFQYGAKAGEKDRIIRVKAKRRDLPAVDEKVEAKKFWPSGGAYRPIDPLVPRNLRLEVPEKLPQGITREVTQPQVSTGLGSLAWLERLN
ncbi:hypothetical protein N7486_002694 [Penicillium sp. IBT 16267x]|nr:hypothetical protein N7486_002694 [Penicillium sp. IBT 16267x]